MNGIFQRLKKAKSADELEELLQEINSYQAVSEGTLNKAGRIAVKRMTEIYGQQSETKKRNCQKGQYEDL